MYAEKQNAPRPPQGAEVPGSNPVATHSETTPAHPTPRPRTAPTVPGQATLGQPGRAIPRQPILGQATPGQAVLGQATLGQAIAGEPGPGRPWPEIPGVPRPGVPRPGEPGVPGRPERAVPQPILPSWYEPSSINLEREVADRLLAERVILVGGRLDDALAGHVAAQLLLLDAQSNDPVELHLSSTESDLAAALSVAAAIDLITAPVHAIARGTVCGPAVAVLAAAEQREAHRHATFVLSAPHFTAAGTADELATLADQHEHQAARLRDLIAHATGRSPDEITTDLATGRVLTADDAQTYGLVTRLR